LALDLFGYKRRWLDMEEYISGFEVANAIADDEVFFEAYVLEELTPFYKKRPQRYDTSCLTCERAQENGQPDPFICDTDPDPETYADVLAGYSRHEDCGYACLVDDIDIVERLKRSSFRRNEFETYMRDMELEPAPPIISTPLEYLEHLKRGGITDKSAQMVLLYEYAEEFQKDWKLRQWAAYCIVEGLDLPTRAGQKVDYGEEFKKKKRRYNVVRCKN
jgi:hypothetical protein